jgi:hypothetical protein
MSNNSSIFQKIDEFVFGQIESLITNTNFQQFLDQFSSLEENVQKVLNYIFSVLIVIIPLIIVIGLEIYHFTLSSKMNIKWNIYSQLKEVSIQSKRLFAAEKKVIGPRKIPNRDKLNQILIRILKSNSIKTDNVTVSQVQVSNFLRSMTKLSATLKFKGLSTTNLTDLLKDFLTKEKFIIPKLVINKNLKTEFLDGEIKILHHSKEK